MNEILTKRLERVGLTDAQARIYLSMLNLGQGTLTQIARKAGIEKSTVFYNVKYLVKVKLIFKDKIGNKKLYFIKSPNHGLRLYFEYMIKKLLKHQHAALEAIDGFQYQYEDLGDRPQVSFIKGNEALPRLHKEVLHGEYNELYEIINLDLANRVLPPKRGDHRSLFKQLKRHAKTLYTSDKGAVMPLKDKGCYRYYLPSTFHHYGEVICFGNKIALTSFTDEIPHVVIIKDADMAGTMRQLFQAAFEGAEKYQKKRKKNMKKSHPVTPPLT